MGMSRMIPNNINNLFKSKYAQKLQSLIPRSVFLTPPHEQSISALKNQILSAYNLQYNDFIFDSIRSPSSRNIISCFREDLND